MRNQLALNFVLENWVSKHSNSSPVRQQSGYGFRYQRGVQQDINSQYLVNGREIHIILYRVPLIVSPMDSDCFPEAVVEGDGRVRAICTMCYSCRPDAKVYTYLRLQIATPVSASYLSAAILLKTNKIKISRDSA